MAVRLREPPGWAAFSDIYGALEKEYETSFFFPFLTIIRNIAYNKEKEGG